MTPNVVCSDRARLPLRTPVRSAPAIQRSAQCAGFGRLDPAQPTVAGSRDLALSQREGLFIPSAESADQRVVHAIGSRGTFCGTSGAFDAKRRSWQLGSTGAARERPRHCRFNSARLLTGPIDRRRHTIRLMASAREIGLEVLPHFKENVLAGRVLPYGYYAKATGRDIATESMAIGQAMHAIGGMCAFTGIPVAPLHFVRRADGEWRGIFEADVEEKIHVWPHYDLLCLAAKCYAYTEDDFRKIDKGLREVLPRHLRPDQLSPHDIWHLAIHSRLKDSTPFQRSLERYRQIVETFRAARRAR